MPRGEYPYAGFMLSLSFENYNIFKLLLIFGTAYCWFDITDWWYFFIALISKSSPQLNTLISVPLSWKPWAAFPSTVHPDQRSPQLYKLISVPFSCTPISVFTSTVHPNQSSHQLYALISVSLRCTPWPVFPSVVHPDQCSPQLYSLMSLLHSSQFPWNWQMWQIVTTQIF